MPSLAEILVNPFITLFAVIAAGLWLGSLRVRGISLGSAGVLFAALIAGHFRKDSTGTFQASTAPLPAAITDLGLLLFVYAVGLQAGPRFASMFRTRAKAYLAVGLGSMIAAAATAVVIGRVLGLSPALTAGLFTGALTNTPALASGRDIVSRLAPSSATEVSVGHGIAYPFSAIVVVLLVQILPALFRQEPERAAEDASREARRQQPPLDRRQFRVTNPNVAGLTLAEFHASGLTRATVSRIKREGVVYPASPEMNLHLHDVVLAVGPEEDLAKLTAVLGAPADDVSMLDTSGRVTSETVVVSARTAVGRQLGELLTGDLSGVVVTRVRRQGIELVPDRSLVLEPADALRVVGSPEDVKRFAAYVGAEETRLSETTLLPFSVGVCLGALLGMVPLPLFGGVRGKLGLGGGAFLLGLFLGHARRIGPFRVYVPQAAIQFARELGLVIFLAGAGLEAGQRFVDVLRIAGPQTLLAGACVTTVACGSVVALGRRAIGQNALTIAGTLSGAMTNPPALNAANELAPSDASSLAFASIYPVAIIAKIVLVQIVFLVARTFG